MDLPYCTYVTTHPTGFRYVGKAQVARINKGYTGSGIRLRCAYHHPGFEPATWTTTILARFATEQEAFQHEAELVPPTALCDPFLLNDTPGGRTGYGNTRSRLLRSLSPRRQKKPTRRARPSKVRRPSGR